MCGGSWHRLAWVYGLHHLHSCDQYTLTLSQNLSQNFLVQMKKIFFSKTERDITHTSYIHFVNWSLIVLSEFYIVHASVWTIGGRGTYQREGVCPIDHSSNYKPLEWGADIITIFLQLPKQYIRYTRCVISLDITFDICFIILAVCCINGGATPCCHLGRNLNNKGVSQSQAPWLNFIVHMKEKN